jgi:hypothetical protein
MADVSLKEAVSSCADMIALIPHSDREAWEIHTSVYDAGRSWYAYAQRKINGMGDTMTVHRLTPDDGPVHYEVRLEPKGRLTPLPRIPDQTGATPAEAIAKLKKYLEDMAHSYKFTAGWICGAPCPTCKEHNDNAKRTT